MSGHIRVGVVHGANLDALGARDPKHYGSLSLGELEIKIKGWAKEFTLDPTFFQTNSEGEFIDYLHRLPDLADAAILNAGAWTHYSYAIRDAVELSGVPVVEVHLSDVTAREDFRKISVFDGLESRIGCIYGKGPDGYREALELIGSKLGS